MSQIHYDIFLEAVGNRPLTSDKIQIGFKHIENGKIVHSECFSIPELEVHIMRIEDISPDSDIYSNALNKAKILALESGTTDTNCFNTGTK